MNIEDQIKVMQAFKAGSTIESTPENNDYWTVNPNPKWNWVHLNYRIKEEPKLVPFSYDDAELLIGKAFKSKGGIDYAVVTRVIESFVCLSSYNMSYKEFLNKYTFLDGSPCGKFV